MNTLFVVVGILAAIIVGPTDASTTKPASVEKRTMVDVDDNARLVSVHADIESQKEFASVPGTVDVLLFWDNDNQGIAGNLMFDHEDGSHCAINADPEKNIVSFGSGTKTLHFEGTLDGAKFILTDDNIRNKKGKPKRTRLPMSLVMEMMDEALTIGLLDENVSTILDCAKDYFYMYDHESSDGRLFGGWVDGILNDLIPEFAGCSYLEMAALAVGLGSSFYRTGVDTATQCYTEGIRPAIDLFGSGITAIFSGAADAMSALRTACGEGVTIVTNIIDRVEASCFFNDDRRLEVLGKAEVLEITDGTN